MATLKLLNATAMSGPTTTTNFTIFGLGTEGSPYSGNSTNSGLHNTTANATFLITGSGTGTLEYDVTISSEQNFDFGRILKNGVQQLNVSGPTTTHTGSFSVSPSDSVQVQYIKDGSVNGGLDVFTVNSLFITGSPTVRFLGASTFRFIDQTPTLSAPSIGSNFTCTIFVSFDNEVVVNFGGSANNSGIESITIRYSFNANFSESGTTTVNGGTT